MNKYSRHSHNRKRGLLPGIDAENWTLRSESITLADIFVVLMAVALPWSTTAFSIFAGLWLLVFARSSKPDELWKAFSTPQCLLPVALFALTIVGMLWADASLSVRLHVVTTFVKLLAFPLLVYQSERSRHGLNVFLAFLASCTALLFLSWLNWFDHRTIMFSTRVVGVPVKNWITQGVEFVLCVFGAAALGIAMWRAHRYRASLGFALLSLIFLLNIVFVAASRTALVTLPILFLIATFRYLGSRKLIALYGTTALIVIAAWFVSPNLRSRLESLQQQFMQYEGGAGLASVGLRIEYWTKSLKFVQDAPLLGHGTGTIRNLFERDAIGKSTIGAEIVANPHNQTLYCAIQWGAVGVFLLWMMWIYHLSTFSVRGWISWLGMLTVLQNILSSLFNSHITDFVEGWIYVLGVGIATGMIFRLNNQVRQTP